MTKYLDSLGLKRLVTKIAEAVGNGTWLPVRKGDGNGSVVMGDKSNAAIGNYSHAEGINTTAIGNYSNTEGTRTKAQGSCSHAEGNGSIAYRDYSHAEGYETEALGQCSHTEGGFTKVNGFYSHAEGTYNHDNKSFINMIGVGGNNEIRKNAVAIYVKRGFCDNEDMVDPEDPKTGYQYLLGVGGYQGQDIAEGMKSVQEVIADLEKGVAATETMTVEDIREIMSA